MLRMPRTFQHNSNIRVAKDRPVGYNIYGKLMSKCDPVQHFKAHDLFNFDPEDVLDLVVVDRDVQLSSAELCMIAQSCQENRALQ
eukprot:4868434-Amphidinium_carterae.1